MTSSIDLQRMVEWRGALEPPRQTAARREPSAGAADAYEVRAAAEAGRPSAKDPPSPARRISAPPEILATAPKLAALDWVSEHLPKDLFADTLIILGLHGQETQEATIAKLIEHGADPSRILWAPPFYSADPETLRRVAQYGVHVVQPPGARTAWPEGIPTPHLSPEEQALRRWVHERTRPAPGSPHDDGYRFGAYEPARLHQLRRVLQVAPRLLPPSGKVLVGDDGGLIQRLLHQDSALTSRFADFSLAPFLITSGQQPHVADAPLPPHMLERSAGVEQTTRGMTELSRLTLHSRVVDVARAMGKKLERGMIAESILSALLECLPDAGIESLAGKRLVLAAYGWIGSAVARLAKSLGFDVVLFDNDEGVLQQAERDGFTVTRDLAAAVRDADVLLGCAGKRVFTRDIFAALREGCVVASGSSTEVEGEVSYLGRRRTGITSRQPVHRLRRLRQPDGREHYITGTEVEALRTHVLDGKRFFVANGLRPINLKPGPENIESEKIMLTRALVFAALAQAQRLSEDTPAGVHALEEAIQKMLMSRLEALWATLPKRELTLRRPIDAARQQRWARFCERFAAREPGATLGKDTALAALAAPRRFPQTPDDQELWCRLFVAPDGTLMFLRAPEESCTVPLPIKNERPLHVELLHVHDDTYRFALWTEDEKGERRARVVLVEAQGHTMPYEQLPEGARVEVLRELPGAALAGYYVSQFLRDPSDPRLIEPGVDLWPNALGTHGFERKNVFMHVPEGTIEIDPDGEAHLVSTQKARVRHNRLIEQEPLRVSLVARPNRYHVSLPQPLTEIVDVVSHFNLDLVIARDAKGAQYLVPIEWPAELLPEGWPRGDAPAPEDDPVRRLIGKLEPGARFDIKAGAQAVTDRHTIAINGSHLPRHAQLRLGAMQLFRLTDKNGEPTVQVNLYPGAESALSFGFPNRKDGGILVSVSEIQDEAGQTVGRETSTRLTFEDVREMDPRREPSAKIRVAKSPARLKDGEEFRSASFDPVAQTWRVHVHRQGEPDEDGRWRRLSYSPSEWSELEVPRPHA